MQLSKSKIEAIMQRDLRQSAFHEAGHLLVADHYKIRGVQAIVFATGVGSDKEKYYRGQMRHPVGIGTPYQWSVISWAGVVAEGLAQQNLEQWQDEIDSVWILGEWSDTDQEGINGYADPWKTFIRCVSIIEKRTEQLQTIAEGLIKNASHIPTDSFW